MKIAILLTCHNRKDKTLHCLTQIYSQIELDLSSVSIYLVDDGSIDETASAVANRFPEVHLLKGDGNLYWNRGMLLAWKEALKDKTIEAVIWLNDDTILIESALRILTQTALKYKGSIIVGSTACRSDHTKLSYGGYNNYNELLKPTDAPLRCKFFNGNIVLVPTSVSEEIGLLDSYYRHSKGDFDYGVRASKNDIPIWVLPVIGYCDRNDSYTRWRDPNIGILSRLKYLYSPLGSNPFEAFHYYKQISIKKAFFTFGYLHMAALLPSFFTNRSSLK